MERGRGCEGGEVKGKEEKGREGGGRKMERTDFVSTILVYVIITASVESRVFLSCSIIGGVAFES